MALSLAINETLKWFSSLPILMQKAFWWRQCSGRYIIFLSPHLDPPFSSSLISLMVSVDVKHRERRSENRTQERLRTGRWSLALIAGWSCVRVEVDVLGCPS